MTSFEGKCGAVAIVLTYLMEVGHVSLKKAYKFLKRRKTDVKLKESIFLNVFNSHTKA